MPRVEKLIRVVGMEPDRTVIKTVLGYEAVMMYNSQNLEKRKQQQAQIARISARINLEETASKCINMHVVTVYRPERYRIEMDKDIN